MKRVCAMMLLGMLATIHTVAAAATDMPRLPAGKHLGALTGFDTYPPEILATLNLRLNEMKAAIGVGNPVVQRVQLDWLDLEPGLPGLYDTAPLVEALEAFDDENEYIFVLLTTVDSEGIDGVRPIDLNETPFADEVLWQRFQSLLQEAVLPILQANERVFLLSIGNEPGSYIEENPSELLPMATFLNQARTFVHESVPSLSVGLTMDQIFVEIADASDVVIFNQYGLKSNLDADFLTVIDDPQDFVTTLHQRQAEFGMDRPFVIQELGIPSGWEHQDSTMNATPEFAAQVARVMIQELIVNPSWRVAFWFTTVDWSVELIDLYLDALGQDGIPAWLVARLEEWLRTGGLLRYQQPNSPDELSPRLVWNEFLSGLESISQANLVDTDPPTIAPAASPTSFPNSEPTTSPTSQTDTPTKEPETSPPQSSSRSVVSLCLPCFLAFLWLCWSE